MGDDWDPGAARRFTCRLSRAAGKAGGSALAYPRQRASVPRGASGPGRLPPLRAHGLERAGGLSITYASWEASAALLRA